MNVVPIRALMPVGGSEAAAAAGVDPYRSRVMLWAEKTGRIPEREPNEAMRWGNLLEPVILAELAERGFECEQADGLELIDPARPWIVGHPDGFTTVCGETALLEVKTVGAWAHRSDAWGDDAVPISYAAQIQLYLYLADLRYCLLAALIGGQRLELREVRRDERAVELLLARVDEFWREYVEPDRQPPPGGTESDREALLALYPQASERVVRLDRAHVAVLEQLRDRRRQLDALEAQKAELENALKAFMGDAHVAINPNDDEVVRWSNVSRTALDAKRLRAERPDVCDAYATITPTRRFSIL